MLNFVSSSGSQCNKAGIRSDMQLIIREQRWFIINMIFYLENQPKIIELISVASYKIKIQYSIAFLNARDNWLFYVGLFTIVTKLKIKLTRSGKMCYYKRNLKRFQLKWRTKIIPGCVTLYYKVANILWIDLQV